MTGSLVSILIPCHNAEKWVAEAVSSCLAQTYAPIEIIVVDDGSTDGSLRILQELARDNECLRVVAGNHAGAAEARNLAISHVRGEYVQFLDADDLLAPTKIASQVEAMESPNRSGLRVDVAYSDWQFIGDMNAPSVGGKPLRIMGEVDDFLDALLADWWSPPFNYLFRREVTKGLRWRSEAIYLDDFDFVLQVALRSPGHVYVPCISGYYRMHSEMQFSRNATNYRTSVAKEGIYRRVLHELASTSRLTAKRRRLIAEGLWICAATYYDQVPPRYKATMRTLNRLYPRFYPRSNQVATPVRFMTALFGSDLTNFLRSARRRHLAHNQ
jgi:glycosyltransferase involved in cell wall biosynthesis